MLASVSACSHEEWQKDPGQGFGHDLRLAGEQPLDEQLAEQRRRRRRDCMVLTFWRQLSHDREPLVGFGSDAICDDN